jgi:hypothetical protein
LTVRAVLVAHELQARRGWRGVPATGRGASATALGWALGLTPLRRDPTLSLQAYTLAAIDCWRDQAQARLR